ncbi:MAG: copper ion binding protein, partial [Desulfohalobiaceae bacterium]
MARNEAEAAPMQEKKQTFRILGMHCASCSSRVEREVSALQGVTSASVNLATEKMQVSWDSGVLDTEQILRKVQEAGYKAELPQEKARIDLAIQGMTCAACSARVQKALENLPGVLEAEVNLATEKARAVIDPAQTEVQQLIHAVQKAGYQASPLAREEEQPGLEQEKDM